ncbi:MAG TPA: DUF2147 domain-containing protein [Ramlibacter sp.]|nr:DUF2147 domain-containing protein [Ramlibacter sp.]
MRATASIVLTALLAAAPARADTASPVGLWQSVDDVTGKPKALIRISEHQGVLDGRIERLYRDPDQDPNPRCAPCEGARHNQPLVGMVLMSGLKKDGEAYGGGEILDPDNGKVYRSRIELHDGGRKLRVRGYIGVPMLGRSQVWKRQE